MKVWITKYALTDGIIEAEKAEEMRQKKIESLKKQIEKLEEMRFE